MPCEQIIGYIMARTNYISMR